MKKLSKFYREVLYVQICNDYCYISRNHPHLSKNFRYLKVILEAQLIFPVNEITIKKQSGKLPKTECKSKARNLLYFAQTHWVQRILRSLFLVLGFFNSGNFSYIKKPTYKLVISKFVIPFMSQTKRREKNDLTSI